MSFSIYETLKNLYENKNEDADVTFVVHGVETKAHKNIVCDRCEVLKAMVLHRGLTDSEGRYVIADEKVSVENFKSFLKWLYLDDCEVSFDNLAAMFHIANMYMLPSLKKKCLRFVSKACLEYGEIIRCCELALEVEDECPEMLKHCFELVSYSLHGSLHRALSNQVNRASPNLVERLAKDCPRNEFLTEQHLFTAIVAWAMEECKQQNLEADPNGLNTVMAPIAKHIKIADIPMYTWINAVCPNGFFPQEEIYQHLLNFAQLFSTII